MSCKEQVQNSQLNCSTSKQLYSFGHDARFKPTDDKAINDQIYDINRTLDKRATSLGYGNKLDIQKDAKIANVPAPNSYSMKSQFQKDTKGPSMGVSRDNAKFNSILGNLNKTPAPGQYKHRTCLSTVKYTMRQKTNLDVFSSQVKVPGPGKYEYVNAINNTNRFPVSKFKSSGVAIINPVMTNEVKNLNVPGPGTYETKNAIGKAICSKYTDKKGVAFPNVGRGDYIVNVTKSLNNPGPGTYRQKSDFGYYENKISNT